MSFDEAVTIFYDPLAATFEDPDHSEDESRSVTLGDSVRGRLLVVCHVEQMERLGWSAHAVRRRAKGSVMKARSVVTPSDEMRAEYDFDYSKAVRGKYYRRLLKEGANVVVLEPDVAKAFRSSAAVNEALRSLLRMSEATRRLTSRSSGRATSARR